MACTKVGTFTKKFWVKCPVRTQNMVTWLGFEPTTTWMEVKCFKQDATMLHKIIYQWNIHYTVNKWRDEWQYHTRQIANQKSDKHIYEPYTYIEKKRTGNIFQLNTFLPWLEQCVTLKTLSISYTEQFTSHSRNFHSLWLLIMSKLWKETF